jgi:hypothetical protein
MRGNGGLMREQAAIEVRTQAGSARTSTTTMPPCVGRDQYIFSSSWQASLKARNGSANPWPIDCLIPELG